MTKQEFINLFPLKGNVTQEIIDTANIMDAGDCIGAKTLKAALGEEIFKQLMPNVWTDYHGVIYDSKFKWRVCVSTEENVSMMSITTPREVTFIVD